MDKIRSLALWLILGGLLIAVSSYRATRGMIKEINITNRFYPKHYVSPPRLVRVAFNICQSRIPKYLHLQAHITGIYACFPVIYLLFFCVGKSFETLSVIVSIHVCVTFFNFLVFSAVSAVYTAKRNQVTETIIFNEKLGLQQSEPHLSSRQTKKQK